MKIFKAQVDSLNDISLTGKFTALILGQTSVGGLELPREVIYTSPYFSMNQGGLFSIPAKGEMILVWFDGSDYYYISTIVDHKDDVGNVSKLNYTLLDNVVGRYVYNENCLPQRLYFSDQVKNALIFDNYHDVQSKKTIRVEAQLRSSIGKKLRLSDSPDLNCVILQNESGDGIKISGNTAVPGILGPRNITIDSLFSHHYRTENGEMKLEVADGRDLFITNTSNGGKAPDPSTQTGNVNIISKYRAINIFAKNQSGNGSIVLEIGTPGQPNEPLVTIAIKSDGSVSVKSSTVVDIEASEVNVKALNNLNLEATNININATSQLNCKGSSSNFFATGNTVINGSKLDLNPPGASLTIPSIDEIPVYEHDYRISST